MLIEGIELKKLERVASAQPLRYRLMILDVSPLKTHMTLILMACISLTFHSELFDKDNARQQIHKKL